MHELIRRVAPRAVVLLVVGMPLATAAPAAEATSDKKCASLEGCYAYDEMNDFLDVAEDLVVGFALNEYSPQVFWVDVRYVPAGDSGESMCTDQEGVPSRYDEFSYMYCSADNAIYIGQKVLWSFYSEIGDVAPIVGLAHEFGHFMQHVADVPVPTTSKESVHHENQADCFAGAWFDHADKAGLVERPDDLQDIDMILNRIASSEDEEGRTHGTVEERKQSFADGRAGGLAACDGYYPATPLHSGEERERWRLLLSDLRRSGAARRKSRMRPPSSGTSSSLPATSW